MEVRPVMIAIMLVGFESEEEVKKFVFAIAGAAQDLGKSIVGVQVAMPNEMRDNPEDKPKSNFDFLNKN